MKKAKHSEYPQKSLKIDLSTWMQVRTTAKDTRCPNQVKINASSPNAELSTISLTVLRTVWYEILHSAEKLALRAKFAKKTFLRT
jgi:hypothetical protein